MYMRILHELQSKIYTLNKITKKKKQINEETLLTIDIHALKKKNVINIVECKRPLLSCSPNIHIRQRGIH